jgi:HK97 family phage portal protein
MANPLTIMARSWLRGENPIKGLALSLLGEKRATTTDSKFWNEWLGWGSKAGVSVTADSALRSTAVWACIRLISETLASLPLFLYERVEPRGKERAAGHPVYKLLHDAPNPEMTSFAFREMLQAHLCGWGNCFAEIDYGPDGLGTGYPKGLWPLLPGNMVVERVSDKNSPQYKQIQYRYTLPTGEQVILPNYRVLHIPGLSYNGLVGYSPIGMAREAIGLALATEEFGERFFSNGAHFGGFLSHPKTLSEGAQDRLLKKFEEKHQGLSNAMRLGILEEGLKYEKTGVDPQDAQFIEVRKFQISEIARFFHVPPHMIGDLEKATFSNIEHQTIEFVVYTMRPWLVRWEQAISNKLLTAKDRSSFFAEFLVDGLLRGDSAARATYYNQMLMVGALSPNDIREKENMNPYEGGDKYFIPMNLEQVGGGQGESAAGKRLWEIPKEEERAAITGSKKGALARYKMAVAYKPLFEKAGQEIIKREKKNILKAAKEYLGQRSLSGWNDWTEAFYREFSEFIARKIAAPVKVLIDELEPMAVEEVHGGEVDKAKFVEDYTNIFVRQYVASSKGQLQSIAQGAIETEADALEAIDERLAEWEENRPGKIADNETVACGNALAKAVFISAGFVKLMWVTTSGKSCPFCSKLDGQIVGTESKFYVTGLSAANHPPIHQGCQCQIVPAK